MQKHKSCRLPGIGCYIFSVKYKRQYQPVGRLFTTLIQTEISTTSWKAVYCIVHVIVMVPRGLSLMVLVVN